VPLNFIHSKSFTEACAVETMVPGLSHVSVLTTTSVFLEVCDFNAFFVSQFSFH
jgi:hypothetical protein